MVGVWLPYTWVSGGTYILPDYNWVSIEERGG